jgi:hypothetical protein
MKVASSPKTMINTYHTIWCYIPEDNHINREQSRKIFRKTELNYQYFRDIKKFCCKKKLPLGKISKLWRKSDKLKKWRIHNKKYL